MISSLPSSRAASRQAIAGAPLSRRLGLWLLLALGCGPLAGLAQSEYNPVHRAAPAPSGDQARVIVKLRPESNLLREHALSATPGAAETGDVVTARANSLGNRLGLRLGAGRALDRQTQVVTASGLSDAALAQRLREQADVEYAVPDQRRSHFMLPTDPLYAQGPPIGNGVGGPVSGQWYLRAPTSDVAASINASNAWKLTSGSAAIVVAILDTGVRPEHPDLVNRLLGGYDMISDLDIANDGDGRDFDPSDPGDWVTAQEAANSSGPYYQCNAEGSSWHGTMTTSLIGATADNGIGMTGVAPGVQLLPVRVLGKCGGWDSDIIAGMLWAAGLPVPGVPGNVNPARVISMSLGSAGACPSSYIDALSSIGSQPNAAIVVAAAGNGDGLAVGTPANCPGIIAVAGLRHIGTKVGFSDLGPEITISAPAGNCVNTDPTLPCLYPILAATNTGTTDPAASSWTDAFNTSLGTSFSAPLVAGTVALMLSVQPTLTGNAVKAALRSSARAFPFRGAVADTQSGPILDCQAPNGVSQLQCYCTTSTCGAGMLDAASAVAAAMGLQPRISVSPAELQAGVALTLSSAATAVINGRSVVSWQWTIVDGGGIVSTFDSGSQAAQATLTPGAAGRITVRLTVTDNQGLSAAAETVLSVLVGVLPTTTTTTTTTTTSTTSTSTSTSAPTTSTTTASTTTTTQINSTTNLNLVAGWNLAGNGSSAPLDAATVFGDATRVASVWKWIVASAKWAFYSPSLSAPALASYASSKGYEVLSSINGGDGFWLNAQTPFTLPLPTGSVVTSADMQTLPSGWSLVAIGDRQSPAQFSAIAGASTPVLTLWAWDTAQSKWYFYAPSLQQSGLLPSYIAAHGYLEFGSLMLDPATGFWVDKQ